ncbi:hypothetical protein [Evansella tamaricis]|uniref:Uncharacterized protein n=1 Tax=Evansella tamaricis TaxID=2069301 RepID=A0ABS6JHA2_9BACI|nr:hypothetical protein [Evansella tamaricis]MBU9713050.1 hypothetical protein [Evansella tamaricis]
MKKRLILKINGLFIMAILIGTSLVFAGSNQETSTFEDRKRLEVEDRRTLVIALSDGLSNVGGIKNITIQQESITIKTFLEIDESITSTLAAKMTKTLESLLLSEDLKHIPNISSYEVFIEDKDGNLINR